MTGVERSVMGFLLIEEALLALLIGNSKMRAVYCGTEYIKSPISQIISSNFDRCCFSGTT